MPELPEVETVCRGLTLLIVDRLIHTIIVRRSDLRWPVPTDDLCQNLVGHVIHRVARRGKYLLLESAKGWVIVHLGMSGVLRFLPDCPPPEKHDHVDFVMAGGCLRLTDPRRFGAVLWTDANPLLHPLLAKLGPEPLSPSFHAQLLYDHSRRRILPVKNFIMDSRVVVGIGNIYASEALYTAGIHPAKPAKALSLIGYQRLVETLVEVLSAAIIKGGTTLRDYRNSDGRPGYFQQSLKVYGKSGVDCPQCDATIQHIKLGGRSSFFCPVCQKN